jgi:hypothetical protein
LRRWLMIVSHSFDAIELRSLVTEFSSQARRLPVAHLLLQ